MALLGHYLQQPRDTSAWSTDTWCGFECSHVSEGLGMIFEGLLKFCIWLVVLLVEVVLIGVAAYFATLGLKHLWDRLWVVVTNNLF